MLTFFTTAKPFEGHNGIIQRNALKSWTLLHPSVEVILFGDEPGAADVSRELGLRHEPHVERKKFGTKRLDYMFQRAQSIARHDLLCYINCDIILLPQFCVAIERVRCLHESFLMVGRRWDTDIIEPLDFCAPGWAKSAEAFARGHGVQQPGWSIDYFAFPRRLYAEMPGLVVGRVWWDHWLVWKARQERAAVVDVSNVVTAIHQNHNYGYHPEGAKGVWNDELARENYDLAGGRRHLLTIDDATHILGADGERSNAGRFWAPYWRALRPKFVPAWFTLLNVTRPLRKRLGLRSEIMEPSRKKA